MLKGIDISSYQSSLYDTTGLDFVFTKATEGIGYVNPRMAAQAEHARAAGHVVGFYHFLHPGNVQAQAQYFVDKAASQPGDILACDWEPTSSGTASNADKDAFIKAVKALRPNHRVILYCDISRWLDVDKTGYSGDGLWIADYVTAGKPRIKANWLFHQYTDAAPQGGDGDVANFATATALKTWAGVTAPTPAPKPKPPEPNMALTPADAQTVWAYSHGDTPDVHQTLATAAAQATAAAAGVKALVAQVGAANAAIAALAKALAASGGITAEQVQAAAQAGAKAALAELGQELGKAGA